MAQAMVSPSLEVCYIDKRRLSLTSTQQSNTTRVGLVIFTCNATGTTTTAKGADAVPATADTNVVRRNESFKLFTAAGVAKEETIFRITAVASATGTTTLTFTPAAATAPVSTDVLRRVGQDQMDDIADLDIRLNQISSTTYPLVAPGTGSPTTGNPVDLMTANDKIYALRLNDDVGSLP